MKVYNIEWAKVITMLNKVMYLLTYLTYRK